MDFIVGEQGSLKATVAKQWFEKTIGEEFDNKFCTITFLNGYEIKAVALFDNYNGSNVEFHWSGGFITRKNYIIILDYVFNFLKCNRLTTIPHREHLKTLNILPRLGFKHEATLKYYYGVDDNKDGLVYSISKEDANIWLNKYGNIQQTEAA